MVDGRDTRSKNKEFASSLCNFATPAVGAVCVLVFAKRTNGGTMKLRSLGSNAALLPCPVLTCPGALFHMSCCTLL